MLALLLPLVLPMPAVASTPAEDAAPLPLYLDPPAVRAAVAGVAPALSACTAEGADGAWPLAFAIAADGGIESLELSAEGVDTACLSVALAGHGLPPHHGAPVGVRATLHITDGGARLGPIIDVTERVARGLFLVVPPDLSAEAREQLLDGLGVGTSGTARRAEPGEVYTPAQP